MLYVGAGVACCGYLTLEDVQADPTKSVDIGMIDLGQKADLGWHHRVVLRQEQLQLELAACRK